MEDDTVRMFEFLREGCMTEFKYKYCRRHKLFAQPACHTVVRAESPVCRTLELLNTLLIANPECDVFADGWRDIMRVCLVFCERKYARVSTIPC